MYQGNLLNLSNIKEGAKDTVLRLLQIESGCFVASYEELLAIQEYLSLAKLRLYIFENNLYGWYPNQSNLIIPNIDLIVENSDTNAKEDEIFNEFYVYSDIRFGHPLIQYRQLKIENHQIVEAPFFQDVRLTGNYYEKGQKSFLSDNCILASDEEQKYFDLKYSPFNNQFINNNVINVLTDIVTLKTNITLQKELRILKDIYEKSGSIFNILLKHKEDDISCRKELMAILKRYWSSDSFRDLIFYCNPDYENSTYEIGQGVIVEEIVRQVEKAQNKKLFSDIFITAPTGSGKSVLFQIPAIYLAEKENLVTVVISPLIALMIDQVTALSEKGINCAAYINSELSLIERDKIIQNIKSGQISIIYLSPESLLSHDLREFIGDRSLGLLVIDEAHLVTTWGRDFRIDYWYLGTYIKRLRKYMSDTSKFPVLALTATAVYGGNDDVVFETVASLNMQVPKLYIGNVRRDEIEFDIRRLELTKGATHELLKLDYTQRVIESNIEGKIKTIAYFPWANQIKVLEEKFASYYQVKIGCYYGEREKTQKRIVMEGFQSGNILAVLATKAFGMGIDVSDIQQIYHHAPSGNLADYVQEIGRVARKKGMFGKAAMDYNPKDLKFTKILTGLSLIKQYQVKYVLQKLWELYSKYNRRQLLVSVEDFGFIFSDDSTKPDNLERGVKSSLLLLETDLYHKVNERYFVIMVRPKSLYSIVFACLPTSIQDSFLTKYGKHCKKVITIQGNIRMATNSCTTSDLGDIYEINLNEIWESHFDSISFPQVKYKFFRKELFTEFGDNQLHPRYKLDITLVYCAQQALSKVEAILILLRQVFIKLNQKNFKSTDLIREIKYHLNDEVIARRMTNLLTNLFSSGYEYDLNNFGQKKLKKGAFLHMQPGGDESEATYSVDLSRYDKEKNFIIRKFNLMFPDENQTSFCKYISTTDNEGEYRIKIAYLLESLMIGSYEIAGGKLSQIFIRINEPYKLKQFASDSKYHNEVLKDIYMRHDRSVKQMDEFFNSTRNNVERWEYIERYFLGNDPNNDL